MAFTNEDVQEIKDIVLETITEESDPIENVQQVSELSDGDEVPIVRSSQGVNSYRRAPVNLFGGGGGVVIANNLTTGGATKALSAEMGRVLKNMIPTSLSQLPDDNTHRTVTDSEKKKWNDKYTKTEVNNLISSAPESDVIVVEVPSGSDIATYLLNNVPAAQRPNNIFRVPGTTSYSEWGWNGTAFIQLDEKNYGIDDAPLPDSGNLLSSKGAFFHSVYSKELHIVEETAKSGWQVLEKPITGLVFVSANHPIRLATAEQKGRTTITIGDNTNVNGIYLYLPEIYTHYFNSNQVNDFAATIKVIDIEDIFGGNVSPSYSVNWQGGYYNGGTLHNSTAWQYAIIDVIPGKYYLVPFSDTNSVQPIVNLDVTGNFVSVNKIGSQSDVYNTFSVVKAETSKLAITYYLKCQNFGTGVSASAICRLPCICLSDCKIENPYNFGLEISRNLEISIKNMESELGMNYTPIELTETDGEWHSLSSTQSGLICIESPSGVQGSVSFIPETSGQDDKMVVIDTNFAYTIITLPESYEYKYYKTTVTGIKVHNLNNEDIIGRSSKLNGVNYTLNWQKGHVAASNGELVFNQSTTLAWLYTTIDVVAGHYYMLPFSDVSGACGLVNCDGSGNIISVLKQGKGSNTTTIRNTFAIVKASTEKIGITYYGSFLSNTGNALSANELLKLPYFDFGTKFDFLFPFNIINEMENEVMDNLKSLFNVNLTTVTSWNGGYYGKNNYLETNSFGNWRYSIINVDAGNWYLINIAIHTNIRIFDVDENDNMSINTSVPSGYYDIASNDRTSWVLVKPRYNKLGICFINPVVKTSIDYQYPKYGKLSRTKNNGLIMLFLQLYAAVEQVNKKGGFFVVNKSGGGDYTSLTEAIMDNFGYWGVTLYVDEGEYDLLEELEDYYGTSDFLSLTPKGRGIELGYDITIKSSPNAVIKADYAGNDTNMETSFSPFNCLNNPNCGGFSLIGVNIKCSRVRYCVHDEKTANGVGSYVNKYENCNFYIDNTNNTVWHSSQCIGGGLGHSGTIIIRGCMFEQIEPNNPSNACVSYHNNRNAGAKSFISCVGNYVKGNRGFRFSWYGQSQEITDVILEGNNVGRATIISAETQDASPYENMSVKEWNTVIR